MLEKNTWHSVSDSKQYNDKEKIITELYNLLGQDYSRKDLMFWVKNVSEYSMDDPTLVTVLPNEIDRKFVIEKLMILKKIGLDN